jgi:hypothetical protein
MIAMFGDIGGWYSFQALQKFLEPAEEKRWEKALDKFYGHDRNQDVSFLPPWFWAVDTLARLVPNPPAEQVMVYGSPDPVTKERLVGIWQQWITEHKEELSKLEPTGEGVDFSANACKDGRPRKR